MFEEDLNRGAEPEPVKIGQESHDHKQVSIPGDPEERALIMSAYRKLLKSMKNLEKPEDKEMIRAAFELAAEAHQKQRRKSGEPYILHPIEVARICSEEIGLGPTAVICALLHDVVEDTDVKLPEIRARFGERIALIVDGLTKLDSLHESENPQAENIGKVLRAMVSDVRVVLVKMADRLHNLRTIKSMPPHKQLKIAVETSTVYAPIAHRLGLYNIKTEFQDACLKITHPEEYHEIADKLAQTKRERERYIKEFIGPLQHWIVENKIPAKVFGRPKSIYSIWNKIKSKHVAFEDIYDLFAIRIIAYVPPEEEKSVCWQIYTFITDYYHPIPERLKDWISLPKANGYESLHTTVIGPGGRFVEVQIRSERMDDIAERGFAAHWKYKGVESLRKDKRDMFELWLNNVRDTLENSSASNATEFLNDFQGNLFAEEVHVFTPKGEVKILPKGATALDFAFSIHTNIGSTCLSVKVNNRVVPLSHVLETGAQVQVITSRNQKPSEDWLQFVVTSKAKTRIRAALKDEKRALAEFGKETLARKLKAPLEDNVDMLAKWYGYPNRLEFLSAIHLNQVDLSELKRFRTEGNKLVEVVERPKKQETEPVQPEVVPSKYKETADVIINGEPGSQYKYAFAPCCNPVQGDAIFGYISGTGLKIHRYSCKNANNLLSTHGLRVVKASWGNTVKNDFVTEVLVIGVDKGPGVIQELTDRLYNLGINLRSFSISADAGYFEGRIGMIVSNTDQLNHIIRELKSFNYVSNVIRVD